MQIMDKLKKNKQLVGLVGAVFVIVIALILITVGKSLADKDSSILRNQTKDGLSFENAEILCENGKCTFTVDVFNENKTTYTLKDIDIKFTKSDGKIISLVGYIGDSLESEEGRKITASIDEDIESSTSLEYIINK